MFYTTLDFTAHRSQSREAINAIKSNSLKQRFDFKAALSQVLDSLFKNWNLKILMDNVSTCDYFTADDIATIIVFGSNLELDTNEFSIRSDSNIPRVFNRLSEVIHNIIIALSFKFFDPNASFLQGLNNKFYMLSVQQIAEVYYLENFNPK